jgi:geranylgeranyl reductase family protein
VFELQKTTIYDIAIIGAGPAGTSVAKAVEKSKYSVIMFDKNNFPRNKPCAGVLPPRIYSELDIPPEIAERELNGYRIFSPSGDIVESVFTRQGLIVDRSRFDEFLIKQLSTPPVKENILRLENNNDFITIVGKEREYQAKLVIGTDGVTSVVRRYMGIELNSVALAAQYEFNMPPDEIENKIGNWFEVYYTIPYGYGWLSPMKDSVKIGVGGVSPEIKKDTRKCLDEFIAHQKIREWIGDGEVQNFELHRIPMSGPLEKLTADRTMLAGDAGGFVFPGTGEGIYYAVKSGRLTGEVAISALEEQRFDTDFLETKYMTKLKATGLLSLRDVDFIDRVLSTPENVENYLKRLKKLSLS